MALCFPGWYNGVAHMLIYGADMPLYAQLKNLIKFRIASGQLKAHDLLPGERRLMHDYGLSRTTVRQALSELVSEGVLYRRHGKGTFVAPRRLEQNLATLMGFAEELHARGINPQVRVLTASMCQAPPEAASHLGLPPGEEVAFIERLISVDGEPLFVDRTYLVAPVGPSVLGADLAKEPIYTVVEHLGYPIREGTQTIAAVSLTDAESRLLQVRRGSPALLIRRITYVQAVSSPIEYTEALYRADRYQYQTRLLRQRNTSTLIDGHVTFSPPFR